MKRNKRFIFWTLAILVLLVGGGYAMHRVNVSHQETQTRPVKKKVTEKKKHRSSSTKQTEQADKVTSSSINDKTTQSVPGTTTPSNSGHVTTSPHSQQGNSSQVNPEDMEPNAFIANPATMLYYRTGQQPVVPDTNWVYFDSEAQARAAGYQRG